MDQHYQPQCLSQKEISTDFTRHAKFKPLCNAQAVHVELSLRYWSSSGNFNTYNTTVPETHTTYEHAWVREHCLISHWQPALNHPFILKHLKLKSEGWEFQFKSNHTPPVKLGPRLFQRLRRPLKTVGSVPVNILISRMPGNFYIVSVSLCT